MADAFSPSFTRRNLLLGGGLFCAAALAWGGVELYARTGTAGTVVITDGEGTKHRFPLSEDATHTITTSLGTNVIRIEDGAVCVESSDCPNRTCVEQGHIHRTGQTIVCLPHKLVVAITDDGTGERPLVDAIAG
jgi:hypothetical protein